MRCSLEVFLFSTFTPNFLLPYFVPDYCWRALGFDFAMLGVHLSVLLVALGDTGIPPDFTDFYLVRTPDFQEAKIQRGSALINIRDTFISYFPAYYNIPLLLLPAGQYSQSTVSTS